MKKDGDVSDNPAINDDKIVTFPQGIPGFEKYTKYVVYHKEENGMLAYWLESCDDKEITFTLVAPEQYGLSYELELDDAELEILQADSGKDLAILMTLSKTEDRLTGSASLNANIRGPIIINPKKRLGIQKVIKRPEVNTTIMDSF